MLTPLSLTRRPLAGGGSVCVSICGSACLYVHTCSSLKILWRETCVLALSTKFYKNKGQLSRPSLNLRGEFSFRTFGSEFEIKFGLG